MNVMGKRSGAAERHVNTKVVKTSQSLVSFTQQIPYGLFTGNGVCYLTHILLYL